MTSKTHIASFYINYGSLLFDSRLLDEHIFVHDCNQANKLSYVCSFVTTTSRRLSVYGKNLQ